MPEQTSLRNATPRPDGAHRGAYPAAHGHGLIAYTRRVIVTLLLVALAYLLWRGTHVLLQAFAGVLFAVLLHALADWFSKRTGLRYGWSLTAVVLALLLLVSGVGWLLSARLASQTAELAEKVPQSVQQVRDTLSQSPLGRKLLGQVAPQQVSFAEVARSLRVEDLLSGVTSFLVTAAVIFFVGVFGAAEPGLYREGLLHLVPARHRRRTREAVGAVAFNLRWWLLGQVFLMVAIGVSTTVGLWIIGVPLALTLGLIAGTFELVPYIGPWLSAVPAALMALLVGPSHLIATLALFLALHVLEGYVLLPLVQRRAVLMPPALTLIMQVLFGELLGLMGLFVAAPLTVAAVVLLKMLYVEDTLGDEAVDVPGEPNNDPGPARKTG
jgi:predicted PurR-regulated permease PerM